jgi:hypothetical protein
MSVYVELRLRDQRQQYDAPGHVESAAYAMCFFVLSNLVTYRPTGGTRLLATKFATVPQDSWEVAMNLLPV